MTLSRFLKKEKPVLTTNYTLDFSCWVQLRADAFVHVVFAEYLKMLSGPGLQSYAVQLVKGKAFLFLLLSFLAARGQCKYSLFFLAFCFFEGIEGDIRRSMFVGYCRRTTQGGDLREPCHSHGKIKRKSHKKSECCDLTYMYKSTLNGILVENNTEASLRTAHFNLEPFARLKFTKV